MFSEGEVDRVSASADILAVLNSNIRYAQALLVLRLSIIVLRLSIIVIRLLVVKDVRLHDDRSQTYLHRHVS